MRRGIAGAALCPFVSPVATPPASPFVEDLETLWKDRNPVPRGGCTRFIVKAWPYHHYRERTSPHDCFVQAITKYREGGHEYAFGWLLDAACPDRLRQETLLRNAAKVLEHVIRVYGPEVPSRPGGGDRPRGGE